MKFKLMEKYDFSTSSIAIFRIKNIQSQLKQTFDIYKNYILLLYFKIKFVSIWTKLPVNKLIEKLFF